MHFQLLAPRGKAEVPFSEAFKRDVLNAFFPVVSDGTLLEEMVKSSKLVPVTRQRSLFEAAQHPTQAT
jgi:hypothetical protein